MSACSQYGGKKEGWLLGVNELLNFQSGCKESLLKVKLFFDSLLRKQCFNFAHQYFNEYIINVYMSHYSNC